MNSIEVYYGEVEDYNSSRIVISDGITTTTYGGNFSYSYYGDVYGTLQSITIERLGSTLVEVTDIGRNAHRFSQLIDRGDAISAMEFVLSDRDRVFGSAANDYLMGFDGADFVAAKGGDDVVVGGRGADKLDAGSGADKLLGEGGADMLAGGFGADQFIYREKAHSTLADRDTIKDFGTGRDVIDLKAIDANTKAWGNQKFTFIDDDRFSGDAGELRVSEKGTVTLVFGDLNGDGAADFSIRLAEGPSVGEQDFIL